MNVNARSQGTHELTVRKVAMKDIDPELLSIAAEIESYLRERPGAADTAEHIKRWWLLRQRIEQALAKTQAALDYLEAERVVEKTDWGGYRLVQPTTRKTPD